MLTASLTVVQLNNLVVTNRTQYKRAKTRVANALTKKSRALKRKTGEKWERKAVRVGEELAALKQLRRDPTIKQILATRPCGGDIAGEAGERVTQRLAQQMSPALKDFYALPDWEELSLALVSKLSGRRYKKQNAKRAGARFSEKAHRKMDRAAAAELAQVEKMLHLQDFVPETEDGAGSQLPDNICPAVSLTLSSGLPVSPIRGLSSPRTELSDKTTKLQEPSAMAEADDISPVSPPKDISIVGKNKRVREEKPRKKLKVSVKPVPAASGNVTAAPAWLGSIFTDSFTGIIQSNTESGGTVLSNEKPSNTKKSNVRKNERTSVKRSVTQLDKSAPSRPSNIPHITEDPFFIADIQSEDSSRLKIPEPESNTKVDPKRVDERNVSVSDKRPKMNITGASNPKLSTTVLPKRIVRDTAVSEPPPKVLLARDTAVSEPPPIVLLARDTAVSEPPPKVLLARDTTVSEPPLIRLPHHITKNTTVSEPEAPVTRPHHIERKSSASDELDFVRPERKDVVKEVDPFFADSGHYVERPVSGWGRQDTSGLSRYERRHGQADKRRKVGEKEASGPRPVFNRGKVDWSKREPAREPLKRPVPESEPVALHPSWAARRAQPVTAEFQGKRIVFDD